MDQAELVAWAKPIVRQQFSVRSLMYGAVVVHFRPGDPDGSYTDVHSGDRAETLAKAAEIGARSGRLLVICGEQKYQGKRALLVDAYDLDGGSSVQFAQRWKLKLNLHGRLAGDPIILGPGEPLSSVDSAA
jgi:hypothetical protein